MGDLLTWAVVLLVVYLVYQMPRTVDVDLEDKIIRAAEAAQARGDYHWLRQLWQPLAESGIARAQYNLGLLHYWGQGGPRDMAQVLRWWGAAAAAGHRDAQFNLAQLYLRGDGVAQSDEQARHWLEQASGNAQARGLLGVLLLQGRGGPPAVKRGLRLLRKAAARGNGQAWFNLGTYHHQNGDDRAARRCYRRALATGEARARLALSTLLSEGLGGPRDEGEARRLYEAGGDEPWALFGLGTLYAEGRGVARDDAEARRCFERAGASPDKDVQAAVAEALAELARRESPPANS